jgi:hypothetical protein
MNIEHGIKKTEGLCKLKNPLQNKDSLAPKIILRYFLFVVGYSPGKIYTLFKLIKRIEAWSPFFLANREAMAVSRASASGGYKRTW